MLPTGRDQVEDAEQHEVDFERYGLTWQIWIKLYKIYNLKSSRTKLMFKYFIILLYCLLLNIFVPLT